MRERVKEGEYGWHIFCTCMNMEHWNLFKSFYEGGRERGRTMEGMSQVGTLYAKMEMSQWNPLGNSYMLIKKPLKKQRYRKYISVNIEPFTYIQF
jgi:hypothetical protein